MKDLRPIGAAIAFAAIVASMVALAVTGHKEATTYVITGTVAMVTALINVWKGTAVPVVVAKDPNAPNQ